MWKAWEKVTSWRAGISRGQAGRSGLQGSGLQRGMQYPGPGCTPRPPYAACLPTSASCVYPCSLPLRAPDAEICVLSQRHSQAELKVLQRLCSGGFVWWPFSRRRRLPGGLASSSAAGFLGQGFVGSSAAYMTF